uniref:Uncharacterized protein n=1 Tax=Rhipicephalus zambeziensis TaxID=60191 RepID=A0A224YGA3_9ACAR
MPLNHAQGLASTYCLLVRISHNRDGQANALVNLLLNSNQERPTTSASVQARTRGWQPGSYHALTRKVSFSILWASLSMTCAQELCSNGQHSMHKQRMAKTPLKELT